MYEDKVAYPSAVRATFFPSLAAPKEHEFLCSAAVVQDTEKFRCDPVTLRILKTETRSKRERINTKVFQECYTPIASRNVGVHLIRYPDGKVAYLSAGRAFFLSCWPCQSKVRY